MFRLSTKGDFGLLLLTTLAKRQGELVSANDLATEKHLSIKYIGRILNSLKKAGLVESKEGVNGGYRLTRDPKDINLQEVLTVLEGQLAPVKCLEGANCPAIPYCDSRSYFATLYGDMLTTLRQKTVADLLIKPQTLNSK